MLITSSPKKKKNCIRKTATLIHYAQKNETQRRLKYLENHLKADYEQ